MYMDLALTMVLLHGCDLPVYASLQKGVVDSCRVSAQPEKRQVQSKYNLSGLGSGIGLTLKMKRYRRRRRMMNWGADSMLSPKKFTGGGTPVKFEGVISMLQFRIYLRTSL